MIERRSYLLALGTDQSPSPPPGISTARVNAGRRLRHAPVVRSFGIIGRIDPNGSNVGQIINTLRLPVEWKRENLRAVVFVQEHDTLRITGAGTVELR